MDAALDKFKFRPVSRLEVGHTHFDVDVFHGILSKYLYGCVKTNDSRRSIHTVRAFKEHMYACYPSLAAFVDIDCTWDFDKFVAEMSVPGLTTHTNIITRSRSHYRKFKPFQIELTDLL